MTARRRRRHDEDISKRDGRLGCDTRAGRCWMDRFGGSSPILNSPEADAAQASPDNGDRGRGQHAASEVLEWNQIFIDTLIATNTANSSSQRLGAIVHTAIFDAYNGIEQRYTPIFVHDSAPDGASRRAAVIAAAHTALVGLFPSQQAGARRQLCGFARGAERRLRRPRPIAARRGSCTTRIERGIAWGTEVAQAVLAWRATDGFSASYPPFTGGTAVGQWRPTPPAFGPMSAQGLAFTDDVRPGQQHPVRARTAAKSDERRPTRTISTPSRRSVARPDRRAPTIRRRSRCSGTGNASVHWNQAANQIARANHLSIVRQQPASRGPEHRDGRHGVHHLERQAILRLAFRREVTWRPVTSIPLADTDGNPDTVADPAWLPLITTPSHPEYPAGHPSQNGAGATVLLSHFGRRQTFTLTTAGQPSRTYTSIAQARSDGNNARVWGGMHYPSTVAISDAVGEAIASYVDRNSMQRLRGQDDDGDDDGDDDEDHRERWTALAKNAIVIGAVPS